MANKISGLWSEGENNTRGTVSRPGDQRGTNQGGGGHATLQTQ